MRVSSLATKDACNFASDTGNVCFVYSGPIPRLALGVAGRIFSSSTASSGKEPHRKCTLKYGPFF